MIVLNLFQDHNFAILNLNIHDHKNITQEKKRKKMKLSEYLEKKDRPALWLAKKAGISPASIMKVLSGKNDYRASLLMKISLATERMVTMEEMVNMEKVMQKANKRPNSNLLPKSTETLSSLPISIQI